MDMTTCVGRRTRSRTESYLNDLLNQSKGISVAVQSNSRPAPLRDSSSPEKTKRRRKRKSKDDDEVEFVGTIYPKGKREKEIVVEDDNVGSPPMIALSLESDRACGVSVDDAMGDDDGDVEFVRTIYPEEDDRAVDDENLIGEESPDDDDVVYLGTLLRDQEHVDRVSDLDVDDANLMGEEKILEPDDEVMSLSSGSDDEASIEDLGTEVSDYMEKSSDSSYAESSDSGFDCSEDDEFRGARDTATVKKKSPSTRVYTREKRKTSYRKNDLDVSDLLAKSIWQRKKIVEEDIFSEDETAEVDTREDPIVRERSSEKVHEQRKRRRFHREKKKNHLTVVDLLGDSFENFDVGENLWVSPPINLRFGCEEPEPVEKTEEEKEIDMLWQDMALALSLEGLHSSTYFKVRLLNLLLCTDDHAFFIALLRHETESFFSLMYQNGDVSCSNGKHDFVLDEEIGLKCRCCSYVSVEMKDVSPAMVGDCTIC